MLKEFKEFAMKGNVIDLAIGVIIGVAFGKIVTSFVNDVLMPPLGKLLGNIDFTNLFIVLGEGTFATLEEAKTAGVSTLNYGLFINTVVDFVIVAFAIFISIKQINRFTKKKVEEKPVEPTTKTCNYCFSTINIKAIKCPNCTSVLQ